MNSRPLVLAGLLAAIVPLAACQPPAPSAGTPAGPTAVANAGLPAPDQALGPKDVRPTTPVNLPPGGVTTPGDGPIPQLPVGGGGSGSVISDHGAGVVSDHGGGLTGKVKMPSGLLGNNGAAILSNNSAALIGNNSAGIVGSNAGRYALAAFSEGAVTSAFMYLTDRDEKFYVDRAAERPFATRVDGGGSYLFEAENPAFPQGKDVIVNALLPGNLRLTGYLVPDDEDRLDLDIASTLATEYLRGVAFDVRKALSAYDKAQFDAIVALTREAVGGGAIPATRAGRDGEPAEVGLFDLRLDHVAALRNQYVTAFATATDGTGVLGRLSDAWERLIGYRPTVVTSLLGNGDDAFVHGGTNSTIERFGQAGTTAEVPATDAAAGYADAFACSARGDVFMAMETNAYHSGHIRWIKPDGTVTSVWLPNRQLESPYGVAIEREPVDDVLGGTPGTLIVADYRQDRVFRIPIVDVAEVDARYLSGGAPLPKFRTEVVAGDAEITPSTFQLGVNDDPYHPHVVDSAGDYPALDASAPATSRWRLSDEGERHYAGGGVMAGGGRPLSARYAYLNGPSGVAVDEAGNIYIADQQNHRVRMIPKADGSYFGYQAPQDPDGDGAVDGFGAATPMKAGCLYTIAGNPAWDEARTPDDGAGRWFGAYDAGTSGQTARLDQPNALAFRGGWLYVCELDNQRIRRVSRASGAIEDVAGAPVGGQQNVGTDYDYAPGYEGDGGPATQARLAYPLGIAFDAAGALFVADNGSGRIRRIGTDGVITTVAGRGRDPNGPEATRDAESDGDALRWTDLFDIYSLGVDAGGNVVFADGRHRRVRKLWSHRP